VPHREAHVIDLGLVNDPAVSLGEYAPVRLQAIVAIVLAICVAVLPAGASAAARPLFASPLTIPIDASAQFGIAGDGIYVARQDLHEVIAYSLSTGARRWAVPMPPSAGFTVAGAGDIVLFGFSGNTQETVALQAHDGAERWRLTGVPVWLRRDGQRAAVVSRPDPPSPEATTAPAVSLVDVRTGATLVTAEDAPVQLMIEATDDIGWRMAGVSTPALRAGAGPGGTAGPHWLDFASGREYPLPPASTNDAYVLAADLLLLVAPEGIQAYERDSLRPRWSLAGRMEPTSAMCGAWLCVSTRDETLALDPLSGQVRWRAPWPFASGPGARLMAYRLGSNGPRGSAVIERGTGRLLIELADWRPLTVGERRWVPMVQPVTAQTFALGILDLDRLVIFPLGTMSGYGDCRSEGGYVACRLSTDEIKVWRYRR
jgi:hypothetical protein